MSRDTLYGISERMGFSMFDYLAFGFVILGDLVIAIGLLKVIFGV